MTPRPGQVPDVRWPAPEPADEGRSQIVEPQPGGDGVCPACGGKRKAAYPSKGQTA